MHMMTVDVQVEGQNTCMSYLTHFTMPSFLFMCPYQVSEHSMDIIKILIQNSMVNPSDFGQM